MKKYELVSKTALKKTRNYLEIEAKKDASRLAKEVNTFMSSVSFERQLIHLVHLLFRLKMLNEERKILKKPRK